MEKGPSEKKDFDVRWWALWTKISQTDTNVPTQDPFDANDENYGNGFSSNDVSLQSETTEQNQHVQLVQCPESRIKKNAQRVILEES